MHTIGHYLDLNQAERDKSILEAAGIRTFLAGESGALTGYASILGELRLQVDEADAERARRVLEDHEGFAPLPDDFIPPPEQPPAAPQAQPWASRAFMWGSMVTLAVFGIVAALTVGVGGSASATIGGLILLAVTGGFVGLGVGTIYRRGWKDGSKMSRS